jgi:hypothetical protein
MIGFPQPSFNPKGVRPVLFGVCYGSIGRGGGPATKPGDVGHEEGCGILGPDPDEEGGVLACAFAWDPSVPRDAIDWPHWGHAMQMCDWKGGRLEGAGLDDFVVFGSHSRAWLVEAGMPPDAGVHEVAQWMARASMDFFRQRYGAPLGAWSSLAWVATTPLVPNVLEQARMAKRLIATQWEVDQLSASCLLAPGPSAQHARL